MRFVEAKAKEEKDENYQKTDSRPEGSCQNRWEITGWEKEEDGIIWLENFKFGKGKGAAHGEYRFL